MFQRFHEMRERSERGFTLIELLVVVLIIAILAAIAVPVFLNQRRKAWKSQVESALKDMATAQESYRTDNATYATSIAALEAEGFNYSAADVSIQPIDACQNGYLLHVDSRHDTNIHGQYSSSEGRPVVNDSGEVAATAVTDPCP